MQVLVIDDHTLFRQGLSSLLRRESSKINVSECSNCIEALEFKGKNRFFDLILLDLKLPGVSGLEAVKLIHQEYLGSRLVIISADEEPNIIKSCIEAGAMGYVPKTASFEMLELAIRKILDNGVYLPASIIQSSQGLRIKRQTGFGAKVNVSSDPVKQFTARQLAVLKLLVRGESNKRIAKQLEISDETAKTHVAAVLRILEVSNRTEAVYAAAAIGLDFE